MGAALFTLGLLAVLVGATYLIQLALWLFAFALFALLLAARAVLTVTGAAAWCVWWVLDQKGASAAAMQAARA